MIQVTSIVLVEYKSKDSKMKENLDLITIDSNNVSDVIDILDQYGCCLINNYLNEKELDNLKFEFDQIFSDSEKSSMCVINKHPTNDKGVYAVCKTSKLQDSYKAIKKHLFLTLCKKFQISISCVIMFLMMKSF